MAIKEIKKDKLVWINIDKTDDSAIDYLKKNYKFHQLDLEDIQSEGQTPKIDVYEDYLFLVLDAPRWHGGSQQIKSQEVDIFVGENFLITIQHHKSKEMKNFFYRCMNNKKIKQDWMSKNSGFLLYKLLEAFFHETRPILNNFGKQISAVENEIFEDEPDNDVIKQLAFHRRNVLNFRRIIDPQRYLMSNLSHTRKSFMDESLSIYFDNIRDYLDKLWAIVETYKETIGGLHLTVESIINQKTTKVISILTVISVSLLPLTLLSGIYGMNVAGLPFANNPTWIWGFFIGLLALILSTIWILKKRKWL